MKNILLLTLLFSLFSFAQNTDINHFKRTDLSNLRKDTSFNVVRYYKEYSDQDFEKSLFLGSDSFSTDGKLIGFSRIDTLTGIQYSLEYYENENPRQFNYSLEPLFSLSINYWENGQVGLIQHFKDLTIKHGWFIEYNNDGVLTRKELFENDLLIYSEPIK